MPAIKVLIVLCLASALATMLLYLNQGTELTTRRISGNMSEVPLPTNTNATEDMKNSTKKGVNITLSPKKRLPYRERPRHAVEDRRIAANVIYGNGRQAIKHDSVAHPDLIRMAVDRVKVAVLEDVAERQVGEILSSLLDGLAPLYRPHPKPVKVAIVSTWRSGSTFLEELLATNKATFNIYEPLLMYGLSRIRGEKEAELAQNLVNDLLLCRFEDEMYMSMMRDTKEMVTRNAYLYAICSKLSEDTDLCYNNKFLSEACEVFPWKLVKLVRMGLSLLELLLGGPAHEDLQVILLVRDPRAVMSSRQNSVAWCKQESLDCSSETILCQDMLQDLEFAKELEAMYPRRIHVLRYEDLANEPYYVARLVFDAVGFEYNSETEKFLESHTSSESSQPFSTTHISKKRITEWAKHTSSERLKEIQEVCSKAMGLAGYKMANSTDNINSVEDVIHPIEETYFIY